MDYNLELEQYQSTKTILEANPLPSYIYTC